METYSALHDIPRNFLVGFCLSCAERGSGVFSALADESDAEWFSYILDSAWKAPLGEVEEEELLEILEEFEVRAESFEADDPGTKGFSILQSAMLAANAIAVFMNPAPSRAEMSGQTLETILGSFDFKLSGSRIAMVGAGEEEAVGRLQQLEQDAQNAFVASIRSLNSDQVEAGLTRAFLEDLRVSCIQVHDEFKLATASVAELTGWNEE
ncbi:hypothetical protein AB0B50_40795 [Streptomyces sp. NPDC041068]|uniref:hypothetical protein n=1 Tax=Streptomyces sp. NPDC041068 TaxID=3155130 RepID=UPI003405016F